MSVYVSLEWVLAMFVLHSCVCFSVFLDILYLRVIIKYVLAGAVFVHTSMSWLSLCESWICLAGTVLVSLKDILALWESQVSPN